LGRKGGEGERNYHGNNAGDDLVGGDLAVLLEQSADGLVEGGDRRVVPADGAVLGANLALGWGFHGEDIKKRTGSGLCVGNVRGLGMGAPFEGHGILTQQLGINSGIVVEIRIPWKPGCYRTASEVDWGGYIRVSRHMGRLVSNQ